MGSGSEFYAVRVGGQTLGQLQRSDIERRSVIWRKAKAAVEVAAAGTQTFVTLDEFLATPHVVPPQIPAPAPVSSAGVVAIHPHGKYVVRIGAQTIGPLDVAELHQRSKNWLKAAMPIDVAEAGSHTFIPLQQFLQLVAATGSASAVSAASSPVVDQYAVHVGTQVIAPLRWEEIEKRAGAWLKMTIPIEVSEAGSSSRIPLADFLRLPRPVPAVNPQIAYCAQCHAEIAPTFKFCAVCGRPASAVPRPTRWGQFASWRTLPRVSPRTALVGAAACVVVVGYLIVVLWPTGSYGPPEASALDLTVAPDVSVELLPSASSLADARFDAFDVSPDGTVIVSTGSDIVDMGTGEEVFSTKPIHSFAFVGETLAAVDANDKLGYYEDGRLHYVGDAPFPQARLVAATDGSRLLFYRNGSGIGSETGDDAPALASLAEGGGFDVLTGSENPIDTAGGDAFQTLFSVKNALFRIITPGQPLLVLMLPDPDLSITGIALAGTALYFATERGVYAVEDGVAAPLVIGLGGALRVVGGTIYLLNPNNGRVYRIVVSKGSRS
jgi:hypothetical protein